MTKWGALGGRAGEAEVDRKLLLKIPGFVSPVYSPFSPDSWLGVLPTKPCSCETNCLLGLPPLRKNLSLSGDITLPGIVARNGVFLNGLPPGLGLDVDPTRFPFDTLMGEVTAEKLVRYIWGMRVCTSFSELLLPGLTVRVILSAVTLGDRTLRNDEYSKLLLG